MSAQARDFITVATTAGRVRFMTKPNGEVRVSGPAFVNKFRVVPTEDGYVATWRDAEGTLTRTKVQPTAEQAYRRAARHLTVQ